MTIYNLGSVLQQYDQEYLILEYEHLFIATTLREEVLLLQKKDDPELIEKVVTEAAGFKLLEVARDRNIDCYSGGQRAILACLLMITVICRQNRKGLKLLLNHVLESISTSNRQLLLCKFSAIRNTHGIRIFTSDQGQIREIDPN